MSNREVSSVEVGSGISEDGVRLSLSDCGLVVVPEWISNFTTIDLSGNSLGSLPKWLGNMTNLTALDVSGCNLTDLPESLGNLTNLTALNLGEFIRVDPFDDLARQVQENELSGLPESLGNLTNLVTLDLSNNQIAVLPESLGSLTKLITLDLSDNLLTILPDWLSNLTSLATLILSSCPLTSLPEWLGDLSSMTKLSIEYSQLTTLPESLGNLRSLRTLELWTNPLISLPESLGNLTALNLISIGPTDLNRLPDWFRDLTSLTTLFLGSNRLTSLPTWFGELSALEEVWLWGNQLIELPESLGNLTNLTTLNLSRNQLTILPESTGSLANLTTIDLTANRLTSLPDAMRNLISLTELDLSDNQLTVLPDWLGDLSNLTELNLSGNHLTALPESLGDLAYLTTLNLAGNKLTGVPESLGNLDNLTELVLSDNQLTALPDWLGNLSGLTELNLAGNQLTALPESLENLASLTGVSLSRNRFADVPQWLGEVADLTTLDLSANQLAAVPQCLVNLTSLTTLNLSGNLLTTLPESLGNLTGLTTLNLSGNLLTTLPESLGNLTRLTDLNLSGNQLTGVPDSLVNLSAIETLSLRDNPLKSPLLEISEAGTPAIMAYLDQLTKKAAELWTSKLLVVGEGAVGKTSLIKTLRNESYDPDEPTTHGIRIAEIKITHPEMPEIEMQLTSWDFGGQDIYHATHQFFLSDRSLILLLWNARQGWEQAKLPYWLDIIKARAPYARVILVATHAEGRPIDLPITDLEASYPQIASCLSVENSTGVGIAKLRQKMAEEATELPLMGSRWPTVWLAGVQAVTRYERLYATPEELSSVLKSVGIVNSAHQTYLLRALHLLGDILYFDDDEELRDIIIVRPQWVNDYIARVLDSPEVATRYGILTRRHERELWSDLEPGLRDRFLLMMEKFDLSYRITDDPTAASLVVERLPWENPPYHQPWQAALNEVGSREIRLRYQLSTLPPGIPTWFIAREHRFSTETHWRSGAFLRYSSEEQIFALIRADRQDKTVDLAVRGPVPQLFFSVLQDGFESTLKRYQGLDISRLVPCTCEHGDGTQLGLPCRHLYQYEPLRRRVQRGVQQVQCELSFENVSVAELLFGIAPATTDQLLNRLDEIDRHLDEFRAEVTWTHREFLKSIRRQQSRLEAVCPSIFTLSPSGSRIHLPGIQKLELNLYCEQPGAFHALPVDPYIINDPAPWLKSVGPYLSVLIAVLKHTAPLVGPIMGLTSERLAKKLDQQTELMAQLVDQIPMIASTSDSAAAAFQASELNSHMALDVDYRLLLSLLQKLDPAERWAGLGRVYTPEDEVLWLCSDHAKMYRKA
jgi:internalin A